MAFYGIHLLLIALHPSGSSAALSISRYFADNASSLSICSLFLPLNVLPFILPAIVSHNKTSFLSTCPSHLCFHCQIVFNVHLSFFTFQKQTHLLICPSN